MRSEQQHTLRSLQAARFVAASMVVLYHSNAILGLPRYLGREPLPSMHGGHSGVDFFFVLSGFVIYLAHGDELGRSRRPLRFLAKRVKRLYPPLWIVLALLLMAQLAVPSLRSATGTDWLAVAAAFATWPSAAGEPLLAVEWTLRHEALFYFLFFICLLNLRAGLLIGASVLIIGVGATFVQEPRASVLASPYNLLFGFGIVAAIAFRRLEPRRPILWIAGGILLFAAVWPFFPQHTPTSPLIPLASGLGAAILLFGAAVQERRYGLHVPAFLLFLGNASYAIYLIHFPTISIFAKLLVWIVPHPQWPAFWVLIAAIASTLAGIAFHLVVERPLLARFNTGRRREPVLGAT